jgi:hypothetical protein
MIEVGQAYYYVLDDRFIVRVVSIGDNREVSYKYLDHPDGSDNTTHLWESPNFDLLHKPLTKLHKLLKGIE